MAESYIPMEYYHQTFKTGVFVAGANIEIKSQHAVKCGDIVFINIRLTREGSFGGRALLGRLEEGFRPAENITIRGVAAMAANYDSNLNGNCEYYILPQGQIYLDVNSYTSGKEVNIVTSYVSS